MTRRTPFPFGHFPPGEPHIEKADRRDHNERSQGHDDQCLSSRHELALVCYLSRTAPSAALVVWCVGGGRNVVVMSAPYRCLIAPCGGNREAGFRHIGSVGLGEREQMPKQDNISISLQRGGAAPWIARSGPAMASKTPVTKLLTIVLKSVTFRESAHRGTPSRGHFRKRSECGASARICSPRRSGFGHHSLRYYGRGVGCFHWTGTGESG